MSGYLKPNLGKDGKTVISFRIGAPRSKDPVTGKPRYAFKTIKTDSIRVAKNALHDLKEEIKNGKYVEPNKLTLDQYLNNWLNDSILNLSAKTTELYRYLCRVHIIPEIGNVTLTDLNPIQIQSFYSKKLKSNKLSPRTIQLCHVVIHKALKNACKMNLINRNPADVVDKPKSTRHEMHTMNEQEINKFLGAAKDTEYYNLFYCYLFTGMRRSELLAVRWCDVDLLGMTISVNRSMQYLNKVKEHVMFKEPKTKGSRRLIALSPGNVAILRQQLAYQKKIKKDLHPEIKKDEDLVKDTDLVFSHYDGSPLLPDSITHAWIKLRNRNNLNGIRLHDARHTMATIMLKQGVHPKIVQERLGHSSISLTLDTYSHLVPGLQQQAANGLDSILNKETKLDKELNEILK